MVATSRKGSWSAQSVVVEKGGEEEPSTGVYGSDLRWIEKNPDTAFRE